jgi:hypothetical protein
MQSAGTAEPIEDIKAQALPVLADIYRSLISERPQAVPDLRQFVGSGDAAGALAITETLSAQGGEIGQILEQAQQAEEQAIAETGLQPEVQAAAMAAELSVDTVEKVIQKQISAICSGPLLAAMTELADELQADPDEDPADLAELGPAEYAMLFDMLLADVFDETAG